MKATVLANPIALRSPWISTASPTAHINLLTTDGLHHVALGCSVDMSSNNQTSQQQ